MRVSLARRLKLGAACALIVSTAVVAQEGPGTRTIGLSFDQSFRATENQALRPDSVGTTFVSSSRLGLNVTVRDEVNRLRFNTSTGLRVVDTPRGGRSTDTDTPRLNFAYRRAGRTSNLSLGANYSREDVRFIRPLEDLIASLGEVVLNEDGDAVIVDEEGEIIVDEEGTVLLPADAFDLTGDGRRERYNLRLSYDFRLDSPLSFGIDLSTSQRNYTGTTAANLFDSGTDSASVSAALRLSPVSQARLSYRVSRYQADDAQDTDRTSERISLGYNTALSPVLTLGARLGFSRIETDRIGGTNSTERTNGGVDLTLARPLGNINAGLSVSTDANGNRTSLTLGRSLALPDGALNASVGVTRRESDNDSLRTVARIGYSRRLPSGGLNLSLSRSVTDIDNDASERLITTLSGSYSYRVNDLSSINLRGAYSKREDDSRANLGVTYRRALTEDWAFNTGVRYQLNDDNGTTADSQTVFFNIGRNFTFPF